MRQLNCSPYKDCAECGRMMSVNDAHKKCQKCRNGGKYYKWSGYNEWQRKARMNGTRA